MEWQYRIVKLKGSGAFSDVYEAQDILTNRIVAKKVLRVPNEDSKKRFRRDDSMLRKYAGSPYFVEIYEGDPDGPHPYLILEYSSLGSLQGLVGKMTDWRTGAQWLADIAHGLEIMHAHGDMHRDIKPGNLLRFNNGFEVIKFTDFGYALKADSSGPVTNSVFGTEGYIDPEARQTGKFFPEADIYAAARTMTALFTGNPERNIFRPISGPAEFVNLIQSMMHADVRKRPSPTSIYQTCERLLRVADAPALPVPQLGWGAVLAALGVTALAVLANANSWDEKAKRYRNYKGQYASGWLW